jgi:glycosyltransferase involved in cell wall biosynthesis
LPCYNPQPGWAERIVAQYREIAQVLDAPVNIILVNDGSTTNISGGDIKLLNQSITAFEYISYAENRGKGYALRQGVARADADIIIYTDIDFPYTTASLAAVYNTLYKEGFDVAAGIKNDKYYNQVPPARRYISKMLRSMIGMFFRIPFADTQCGLKGFVHGVKQEFLDIDIDSYLFDLDFIRRVYKKRYKVKPVPVELNDNVIFRRMSYKLLIPEMKNFIKIMLRK